MKRFVNRRSLGGLLGLSIVVAGGCSRGNAEWTFRDAGGDVRTISDYESGVKVLCFSNTWCDPCKEALIGLQQLQDNFADRGVRVVFVSSWEHGDPATYIEDHGYTYGLMLNGTKVAREYDVRQLPTFVVLGLDGKVVARYTDYKDSTLDKLTRTVDKYARRYEGRMTRPVAGAE